MLSIYVKLPVAYTEIHNSILIGKCNWQMMKCFNLEGPKSFGLVFSLRCQWHLTKSFSAFFFFNERVRRANVLEYSKWMKERRLSAAFPSARPWTRCFLSISPCVDRPLYTCGISLSYDNLTNRLGEGESSNFLEKVISNRKAFNWELARSFNWIMTEREEETQAYVLIADDVSTKCREESKWFKAETGEKSRKTDLVTVISINI